MQTSFLIVLSQLFLMMLCTAKAVTQREEEEPKVTTCIDNYELNFFCDAKQFYNAKKVCEDRGSYLVKIDNANMTKIIKDVIDGINCPYIEFFHAGATADNNRQWTWLDGSRVYLQDEGYQNWRDGQPNDFDGREDCMSLDKNTTKWNDAPCSGTGANGQPIERRYYICQKNLTLNIKITESSSNALKCSATSGTCVKQVEWRRNNEIVSTFQNHSVYQELSSERSILHYENATITDGGEYSCVSWVLKNVANQVSAYQNVKVDGTPAINETALSLCNTSLIISWNPSLRAIGFLHRIKVYDSFNGEQVKDIAEKPIESILQVTRISGLQPNSAYHIQITACEDEGTCTDEHTVKTTVTTGGMVIDKATMHQISDNDTCIITWNWPYNISAVFQIFVYFGSGHNISEVELMNKTENELSHSFEMQPGQVYEVQIHVNDSTEVCPETVNVIGSFKGRNVQTTTAGQLTSNDEQTNITNIIVPVVSAITVIILLSVALIVYKMKTRTDQYGQEKRKQSLNRTNGAADYANVGEGEIIAANSTIADQPAVYVNYQQNSSYETVERNQHNITDIYETPIGGN